MRFHFVPPTASQKRRKRRWLGEKRDKEVAIKSCPSGRQKRGEGGKGASTCQGVPIAVNVTRRA